MKNTPNITRITAGTFLGWRRLASCLLALTLVTAAFAGAKFSSIVVFGDSLSDTGRLFRLTNGGFPPSYAYFHGRQTNGKVWVEYLAERMDLEHRLKDYAVVGAMTGPGTGILSTGNVWSDTFTGLEGTSLSGQLAQYLADTNWQVDPNALYIIEGGGNDLIGGGAPAALLSNIATMVITLKTLGAQHIAVVNVPDFGKAPRFVAYGPAFSASVSGAVATVNSYMAGTLDSIDSLGGQKIARIDAFGFVQSVVGAPASFGFTNVTGAFMTLDLDNHTVSYAAPKHSAVKQWLFWDDLHPTTRGHRFLAENAQATLKAAFPDAFKGCRDDDDDDDRHDRHNRHDH